MNPYNTTSPVIFCIFNRPDTTQRVFNEIAKARPPALYVVADAARPQVLGEAELCQECRVIAERVDWPCEITLDYAESNMGCKQRIYSGISNAFKQFDFAIILEDDCLPCPDFFRFVDTMRERYQDDEQVMQIAGTAFIRPTKPKEAYYRSAYPLIWGWATWRRAWDSFDPSMKAWPELKKKLELQVYAKSKLHERFIRYMEKAYQRRINTWDYPFVAHILLQNGHCITPLYNLISNIGFGEGATHTKSSSNIHANLTFDNLPDPIPKNSAIKLDIDQSGIQLTNALYRKNFLQKRIDRLVSRARTLINSHEGRCNPNHNHAQ